VDLTSSIMKRVET